MGTSSGSQWLAFMVLYRSYAQLYLMGRMLKNMVSLPLITFLDANAASALAASSSNVRSPSLTVVVLDMVGLSSVCICD